MKIPFFTCWNADLAKQRMSCCEVQLTCLIQPELEFFSWTSTHYCCSSSSLWCIQSLFLLPSLRLHRCMTEQWRVRCWLSITVAMHATHSKPLSLPSDLTDLACADMTPYKQPGFCIKGGLTLGSNIHGWISQKLEFATVQHTVDLFMAGQLRLARAVGEGQTRDRFGVKQLSLKAAEYDIFSMRMLF